MNRFNTAAWNILSQQQDRAATAKIRIGEPISGIELISNWLDSPLSVGILSFNSVGINDSVICDVPIRWGDARVNTYEQVKSIFVDICGLHEDQISPSTNMVDDVSIDSIDFMDVTYEIDQRFSIKLPFEQWVAQANEGKERARDQFIMARICEEVDRLAASAQA